MDKIGSAFAPGGIRVIRGWIFAALRDLSQKRNKPAAAAHFELAKDRVEMLFHHR
jgi:hypothetical protein